MTMRSPLPLAALAICLVACRAIDCCQDGSVNAVVAGVVVDATDDPQEGVDLLAMNFQKECAGWVVPGPFGNAVTDAEGDFTMVAVIPLMSPGIYCFDIAMTKGILADTARQLQTYIDRPFPPADTARVTLRTAWP